MERFVMLSKAKHLGHRLRRHVLATRPFAALRVTCIASVVIVTLLGACAAGADEIHWQGWSDDLFARAKAEQPTSPLEALKAKQR